MKPTKLYLITGFLGSGKTTLLNHVLSAFPESKTGVVVNEFGRVNIDADLIQRDKGLAIHEINNGSIFCCCRMEAFHQALVYMYALGLDRVLVEATGLADPANLGKIFNRVNAEIHGGYQFYGCYCLVDATHFIQMYKAIPVMERQIAYSNAVIINKCDLATRKDIESINKTVSLINPEANIYESTYGQIELLNGLFDIKNPTPSQNTPQYRPHTEVLFPRHLSKQGADDLFRDIGTKAYRAKGFATIEGQRCYIDIIGDTVTVKPFSLPGEDKIVLLMTK